MRTQCMGCTTLLTESTLIMKLLRCRMIMNIMDNEIYCIQLNINSSCVVAFVYNVQCNVAYPSLAWPCLFTYK